MSQKFEKFCFYERLTTQVIALMQSLYSEKYQGFTMFHSDKIPTTIQHPDRETFTFYNNREMAEHMLNSIEPKTIYVDRITLSHFLNILSVLQKQREKIIGNVALVLPSVESYENLKKKAEELGLKMSCAGKKT